MEKQGAVGWRRSERRNLGNPPDRFGEYAFENPFLGPNRNQQLVSIRNPEDQELEEEIRILSIRGGEDAMAHGAADRQSVGAPSVGGASQRTRTTNLSTTSSAIRRKRQAELDAAVELARLEEEAERRKMEMELELERRKMEREKTLVSKRLLLQKAIIAEDMEMEEEQLECRSRQGDFLDETALEAAKTGGKERVEEWLNEKPDGAKSQEVNLSSVDQIANAMAEAVKMCMMSCGGPKKTDDGDQDCIKELTPFYGDVGDWPAFTAEYRATERKFSKLGNLTRLKKCLRGKAKEEVQAILIVPENVEEAVKTLEASFGRPEVIVNYLISKAKGMSILKDDQPEKLLEFSNAVRNMVATMETLKIFGHMLNPQLINDLIGKLPIYAKMDWANNCKNIEGELSLKDFSKWLQEFSRAMSRISSTTVSVGRKFEENDRGGRNRFHNNNNNNTRNNNNNYRYNNNNSNSRENVMVASERNNNRGNSASGCLFCQSKHEIIDCQKFLEENVQDRWNFVKENRICFCCLSKGCRSTDCPKKKTCGQNGCDRDHHEILHNPFSRRIRENEEPEVVSHATQSSFPIVGRKILLKVIPVTLRGPNGDINTHALLDEGSTVTLVEDSLASELGLQRFSGKINLRWMKKENGAKQGEASRKNKCLKSDHVSFEIFGVNGQVFKIQDARTLAELDLPVQSVDVEKLKKEWNHLRRVDLSHFERGKPRILIGIDNWELTCTTDIIKGPRGAPALSRTPLGWVLHGNAGKILNRGGESNMNIWEEEEEESIFNIWNEAQDPLHELVKKSFSTDEFGVKIPEKIKMSNDDARALEIMEKRTKRIGERFETGLLWKKEQEKLPSSRNMAERRLRSIEKKMDRDPEFAEKYTSKIEENIIKGYARKLNPDEIKNEGIKTWYLPHFAVINPKKPGKVRVVFDAAAKVNGKSLNDFIYKGPDLMCPLVGVTFKFRQNEIAFGADIREMFPQVKIRKEDQDAQRFLWRGTDRKRPPDVYAMDSMVFGNISSPSLAQFVKNKNADEHAKEFPEAAEVIKTKHYVDDYLDSLNSVGGAIKIIKDVIEVHRRGGFEIRGWISNSKEVLASIPKELRANGDKEIRDDDDLPVERVLGLYWSPTDDSFKFTLNFHRVPEEILKGVRRPTKREVLRLVMSIFDPLGFLGNFIIKVKILLQEIWRTGINWDDEITENSFRNWKLWLLELKNIEKLRIPRCYSLQMSNKKQIQLHIFCDASEKAFAAVGYFRVEIGGGGIQTAFVMAKTRVAPLRPLSIPRLELQAALMGTRLAATIKENHSIQIEATYFWSDSKTVLRWIRADARNFKPFVSHRLGEIEETTNAASWKCYSEWKWISTFDNVADEGTRDSSGVDFGANSRWLNGPDFLKLPEQKWPEESLDLNNNNKNNDDNNNTNTEDEELRRPFVGVVVEVESTLPDVSRFSNWRRLIRSTAWILHFIRKIKGDRSQNQVPTELENDEIERAEKLWWIQSQNESFGEEIQELRRGKKISASSRLYKLSPFLDANGILRLQGRTSSSKEMGHAATFPVILDSKHRFTQLLIDYYHVKCGHNGQERVLNELRQRYWILEARTAVRSCWNRCFTCKIRRAAPESPFMGPLPEIRLNRPVGPWTWTGMDYFGPLEVIVGRRHEKRYGVLFTCLSTRAVHLEIANSMTTDSAIMAIRRFVSVRRCPEEIYSDNGKNLRGSERVMGEALRELDQAKIIRELSGMGTPKGINWNFNPPSAPHFGGSWERLVRSVKTALESTLHERYPKEEVLRTLFAEAMYSVNNRPLTHVSIDPDDMESLTPNHFLLGSSSNVEVPGIFVGNDMCLKKQWRKSQRLADLFWRRWVKEYLPTLTRRTKWYQHTEPVKVGNLVLIADGNLIRNCWPRGIVTNIFPGKDGIVRVVDVRTNTGTYRRPVSKICILDVDQNVNRPSSIHGGEDVAVGSTSQ